MQTNIDPQVETYLMDRFEFTQEDLEANRLGKHSDRQRQIYADRTPKWSVVFSLIGVAIGVVLFLDAGFHSQNKTIPELAEGGFPWQAFDWPTGLGAGLTTAITLGTLPLALWWMVNRLPLRRGVKTITGPFRTVEVKTKYSSIPSLAVGKGFRARNFPRNPDEEHLVVLMPYATLYYNQGWAKTIVHSIEPHVPPPSGPGRSTLTCRAD